MASIWLVMTSSEPHWAFEGLKNSLNLSLSVHYFPYLPNKGKSPQLSNTYIDVKGIDSFEVLRVYSLLCIRDPS